MALTAQFQNEISNMMNLSEQILDLRQELQLLDARWNQNDMFNQINDVDIQAIAAFAHLTKSEIANAITAFNAILTALGDNSTGQAVNLIKMKG